jgi:hypothetical protein
LLQKAADDLVFSIRDSIVIGDKASDIEMGRMAGALTFLVRPGTVRSLKVKLWPILWLMVCLGYGATGVMTGRSVVRGESD